MIYELPKLPYAYDALEPYIDAKTVEIHYTKHHQSYLHNLNNIAKDYPEVFLDKKITQVLTDIDNVPEKIRQQVINQGGGYANHNLYWLILSPNGGGKPDGKLVEAIKQRFETYENCKRELEAAAVSVFGSGYGWLVVDKNTKQLDIITTKNQDSPYSINKIPLIVIDVWEHAYYLNYQNRRPEYVAKIFNVINWDEIEANYEKALLY
jgi:Fe-Mn family superoxide dismutase